MRGPIFLDLDGVMADLHARIAEFFGIDLTKWPAGVYDFSRVLGRPVSELWGDPRVQGSEFWASLPLTPWARDVYALAKKHGEEVVFLTGRWLCDHGRPLFFRLIRGGSAAWNGRAR